KVVGWARDRGVIVAADECYLGLVWEGEAPSILDPRVSEGDHQGLLALHSLSKTSNLASYRAGFVAGAESLIDDLLTVRKHAGLIVPTPVQTAMTAALADDAHEAEQRERYRARRDQLLPAVEEAGFRIDYSEAGLYLWATRDEYCRDTVDWFAERGVLVAPGEFYGPAGARHVSIALTATDATTSEAIRRLACPGRPHRGGPGRSGRPRGGRGQSLACSAALSSTPSRFHGTASTAPETELRRNSRLSMPDRFPALTGS